jgi:hypothetical protein
VAACQVVRPRQALRQLVALLDRVVLLLLLLLPVAAACWAPREAAAAFQVRPPDAAVALSARWLGRSVLVGAVPGLARLQQAVLVAWALPAPYQAGDPAAAAPVVPPAQVQASTAASGLPTAEVAGRQQRLAPAAWVLQDHWSMCSGSVQHAVVL